MCPSPGITDLMGGYGRGSMSTWPSTPQNPGYTRRVWQREADLTWEVRHLTLLIMQGGHIIVCVFSLILGVQHKVDLQILPLTDKRL